MTTFLLVYLAFGLGAWSSARVLRRKTFHGASNRAIIKGFLAFVLFPPLALVILDLIVMEE